MFGGFIYEVKMKIKILIGLAFCFFAFPNAQEIEEVIVVGSLQKSRNRSCRR